MVRPQWAGYRSLRLPSGGVDKQRGGVWALEAWQWRLREIGRTGIFPLYESTLAPAISWKHRGEAVSVELRPWCVGTWRRMPGPVTDGLLDRQNLDGTGQICHHDESMSVVSWCFEPC
jgi:hypothetical protein